MLREQAQKDNSLAGSKKRDSFGDSAHPFGNTKWGRESTGLLRVTTTRALSLIDGTQRLSMAIGGKGGGGCVNLWQVGCLPFRNALNVVGVALSQSHREVECLPATSANA